MLLAVLFLGAALMLVLGMRFPSAQTAGARVHRTLIVDPGHGGIDGGAIAYDGTKESDLNLSIALKLRALCDFCGVDCVLTRSDDSRRTDILHYSEHEDLVHRADLIDAVPNGVLISIHQNTYPSSQPWGAQVLYAQGEESRRFGELCHGLLLSALQPENRRVAEPAPKSLYITSTVRCPAILVECGFLSNLSDLEHLKDDHYQSALAAVLLSAYFQYDSQKSLT